MIQKSKNQSDQEKEKYDSTGEKIILWDKSVVTFQDFINFHTFIIKKYLTKSLEELYAKFSKCVQIWKYDLSRWISPPNFLVEKTEA